MKLFSRFALLAGALAPVLCSAAVSWNAISKQPATWYASAEAVDIARNIVLYQRESGGWTKNRSMIAPPPPEYFASTHHEDQRTTIDNGATTTQLHYLAQVVVAADDEKLRAAFFRGIDYLFESQYANGGWPQFFPLIDGYYTHVTYNDNAMANVLTLLRGVASGKAPYTFVDAARRARAAMAVEKGVACILRSQVKQDGKLTAWCAQHDEDTLAPAPARNFEPASLSGMESVGLVRELMKVSKPTPEIITAIESAIAWFESSSIAGLKIDRSPGADGKRESLAVADANAPRSWARFYELGTNKPIYIGRDKVIRYNYNEIERERRVGYGYLGNWPEKLLTEEYPRWRAKHKLP
ncbi:pectate lyase [Oleiharenicola lentus]|uniref:pectate lyase n=1 Tax=Oleiharenicola lentus TaxID=2508720 RepID=UPI003F66DD85